MKYRSWFGGQDKVVECKLSFSFNIVNLMYLWAYRSFCVDKFKAQGVCSTCKFYRSRESYVYIPHITFLGYVNGRRLRKTIILTYGFYVDRQALFLIQDSVPLLETY